MKSNRNKVAVLIATRGRPGTVAGIIQRLNQQSRPPDQILVVGSELQDINLISKTQKNVTAIVGRTGSSHQRNDALALAGESHDFTVFFDDDFVPSHFWLQRMIGIFNANTAVMGLSGLILADGTKTQGITLEEADAIVKAKDSEQVSFAPLMEKFPYGGNIGCNMAYRTSALKGIRFDEGVPLYGWHEDSDVRNQVERLGPFAKSSELWGVHLGHKNGRSSGVMFGYSQIANAVYFAKKGTVPKDYMGKLACKNILANAVRSIKPEPFVDRRGRLKGNLIALGDLALGRISPSRILDLKK